MLALTCNVYPEEWGWDGEIDLIFSHAVIPLTKRGLVALDAYYQAARLLYRLVPLDLREEVSIAASSSNIVLWDLHHETDEPLDIDQFPIIAELTGLWRLRDIPEELLAQLRGDVELLAHVSGDVESTLTLTPGWGGVDNIDPVTRLDIQWISQSPEFLPGGTTGFLELETVYAVPEVRALLFEMGLG